MFFKCLGMASVEGHTMNKLYGQGRILHLSLPTIFFFQFYTHVHVFTFKNIYEFFE